MILSWLRNLSWFLSCTLCHSLIDTGLSIYAFYGIWNSIERLESCPNVHPNNGYSHSATASLDTTHINLESRRGTDGNDTSPVLNIIDDKLIKSKQNNTGNKISGDVKNYEMKPFMN